MLFICGQSFVSGGEFALKSLLENLNTSEEIALICKDTATIRQFFELPNLQVLPFKYFFSTSDLRKKYGLIAYPIKLICLLLFLSWLCVVIAKHKPKIVVSNNVAELPASFICKLFNARFFQYIHEIIEPSSRTSKFLSLFQNHVDTFICVSKASQNSITKFIKSDKTALLYNSTDIHQTILPRKLGHKNIRLIFVGMLNSNKNPLRFLEWAHALKKLGPVSAQVFFHIQHDDILSQAQEYATTHDLEVTWRKNASQSEIACAISQSTFLCVTSHREALSLVALQALSLGIPVITTANGGVNEIVHDSYNGSVIDNDSNLVKKVKLLLNDEIYENTSKNCLECVSIFSHKARAQSFIRIVEH